MIDNYEVIKSDRKTISIEIKDDLRVVVRAPKRARDREIRELVKSKEAWIEKNLAKLRKFHHEHGDGIGVTQLTEDEIAALKKEALADIPARVEKWARADGFTPAGRGFAYNKISIRTQKSRWGSCSAKGNLSFNCLLMLCPEDVRDYVVVHELCHTVHLNHSPAFWAEVEKVMPGYRMQRRWLKDKGHGIMMKIKGR